MKKCCKSKSPATPSDLRQASEVFEALRNPNRVRIVEVGPLIEEPSLISLVNVAVPIRGGFTPELAG